jgi:hypothetical protein
MRSLFFSGLLFFFWPPPGFCAFKFMAQKPPNFSSFAWFFRRIPAG